MKDTPENRRFYDVVWPHAERVLRIAHVLTRNSSEAEDLAQETMLKAFASLNSFREGTDGKAWLMAILRNTRIDRLRAEGRRTEDISLGDIGDEPVDPATLGFGPRQPPWRNPQEVLEGFSDQEVIDALQALPEEMRWTLLLVDIEGWSQDDAAALLEVPVGTIKSRAHRGRAMLRESLLPVARERRLF